MAEISIRVAIEQAADLAVALAEAGDFTPTIPMKEVASPSWDREHPDYSLEFADFLMLAVTGLTSGALGALATALIAFRRSKPSSAPSLALIGKERRVLVMDQDTKLSDVLSFLQSNLQEEHVPKVAQQVLSRVRGTSGATSDIEGRKEGARPIVLYLGASPLAARPPTAPAGTDPGLALDEEAGAIQRAIRSSGDRLTIVTAWAIRPDNILEELNRYGPQVIHFAGHGTPDELWLKDGQAGAVAITGTTWEELFNHFRETVQLVVLAACHSAPLAERVAKKIPCAVGMTEDIDDAAILIFTKAFYQAIGFNCSIHAAFNQGQLALKLENQADADRPKLFWRADIDPTKLRLVSS
jgi:hypothetical protein